MRLFACAFGIAALWFAAQVGLELFVAWYSGAELPAAACSRWLCVAVASAVLGGAALLPAVFLGL